MAGHDEDKVNAVLSIFRECKVDEWARELKEKYTTEAYRHLDDVAVISKRKEPLQALAFLLLQRDS